MNYSDIHKTLLGDPEKFFEHFDTRVRAHPIPAIFSLANGIESFPDTLVPCIDYDESLSPLQRALKDVRMLTTQEQMQNLATLSVYKSLLQFIIDHQNEIPLHQHCVLHWFRKRSEYDPANLEQSSRRSPRKRQKTTTV